MKREKLNATRNEKERNKSSLSLSKKMRTRFRFFCLEGGIPRPFPLLSLFLLRGAHRSQAGRKKEREPEEEEVEQPTPTSSLSTPPVPRRYLLPVPPRRVRPVPLRQIGSSRVARKTPVRQRPRVFVVEGSGVAGGGVVGNVVQPAVPLRGHRRRVLSPVAVEVAVDDPAVPPVLLLRGHALEVAVSAGVGADEGGSRAVDERGLAVLV